MAKRKAGASAGQQDSKRIKIKSEEPATFPHELSAYEKNIQENIRRNNEILTQLNIFQIRNDLRQPKVEKTNPVKSVKMKKASVEDTPRRQSLRIRKLQPDGVTPLPVDLQPISPPAWDKPRHRGQIPMALVSEGNEDDSKALLSSLENLMSKTKKRISISKPPGKMDAECSSYKKVMERMKVNSHHVTKVVPSRIFSIEFHSMEDKTLLFVGDKKGNLGLWDADSKDDTNVFVYEPHTRPIAVMALEPSDHNKLLTCSYDGTIRIADFGKTVFDEVFAVSEDHPYLTYMAIGTTSSNTLLASTADGQIHVVDYRTDNKNCPGYQLHDKTIKCLDVNPKNPNMFVTSTQRGQIALWDVRKLKGNRSYLSSYSHSRSVSSVFFSPNTGNQLLSTSLDNFVSVHDVDENNATTASCMYKHDNNTGRWLSTFQARWDPKTTTCFAVGSMRYPRQVDIYSSTYKAGVLTHLQHENFTTITSRIAFHPSKDMIAGANSSGKVFLWTT